MSAENIARTLGGYKAGGGWMARCPSHDDRNPSLSIKEAENGKLLVHCHTGCEQSQVIAALRARGLWEVRVRRNINRPAPIIALADRPDCEGAKRTKAALAIWEAATAADGTFVETYHEVFGFQRRRHFASTLNSNIQRAASGQRWSRWWLAVLTTRLLQSTELSWLAMGKARRLSSRRG